MIQTLAGWVREFLLPWARPSDLDFVTYLILHVASLELIQGDFRELAPVKGCCGPIRISGNSLPVIDYLVFDPCKSPFMMEFVRVRVEISKPDRIEFSATIEARDPANGLRHGESIPMKESYRRPFERVAWHLFQYFPFYFDRSKSAATVRETGI